MQRQCAKYHLPWKRPSNFPHRAILPVRVAILGSNQRWISAYTKQIMLMNFAEDRDVEAPELVGEALQGLGLPAPEILHAAQTHENKLHLREQTETARIRGVFGAPTFLSAKKCFGAMIDLKMPRTSRGSKVNRPSRGQRIESPFKFPTDEGLGSCLPA